MKFNWSVNYTYSKGIGVKKKKEAKCRNFQSALPLVFAAVKPQSG